MSKASKIILIILFVLLLVSNFNFIFIQKVHATTTPEQSIDQESANSDNRQATSSLDTLSTSSVTKVSTINSYEQANLQLNNILSIILISIGVLLILFAIAILIRLKK